MAKLAGKEKAAFLRRMARGRTAAARRRARGRPNPARKVARKKAKRAEANPQLLVISNPALRSAVKAYERFHGVAPKKVKRIGRGKNPRRLVSMGQVIEVVYEPRRGQRRRVHWFHRFKGQAVLLASPDGKELCIVDPKGRALVDFDRGIVG